MSELYELPVELIEAILLELPYSDLAIARNTCTSIRALCDSTVIPEARRRLVQLRHVANSDRATSIIRKKLQPFFTDFDRDAYLCRIENQVQIPQEFASWILETPTEDVIGWHWPGLQGECSKQRYDELGLDYYGAMMFSKNLKPGYTLLPFTKIMEVEDPDYSEFNDTDHHFYPGSWQCQRMQKDSKVRALQVWADMSGYSPKMTLLILSGSERWDGHVWLTESRAPFRHSPESITASTTVQLVWQKSLGTWIDYLQTEAKELHTNYHSMARVKTFRPGLSGRMVYEYT